MSSDVSEERAASIIALMMEEARTLETSVDIQLRTRQYIPEDSKLHTRRRENLKSHKPTVAKQTRLHIIFLQFRKTGKNVSNKSVDLYVEVKNE
jgi:hypothetical protein